MHRKLLQDRDPVSRLINRLVAYLNLLTEKLDAFMRAFIACMYISDILQCIVNEGRTTFMFASRTGKTILSLELITCIFI